MRYGRWETIGEWGAGGQGKVYLAHDITKFNQAEIEANIGELIRKLSGIAIQPKQKAEYSKEIAAEIIELNKQKNANNLGALKKLHDTKDARDITLAIPRMKREVEALKSIQHKNVTRVLDNNIDEHWFVTEFYPNGNLMDNKPHFIGNIMKTIKSFRTLVEGVMALHEKGIVHRDIKPENIFVREDGELVLGDFGLVFFSDEKHTRISETFENVGSRDWMPGWAYGSKVDDLNPSFDIFALGKILWFMLSKAPILPLWYYLQSNYNLEEMYPGNTAIRWVNELFSQCIVEKEKDCLENAKEFIKLLDATIERIDIGADLISKEDWFRPCRVCGKGKYEGVTGPTVTGARNFGLSPAGTGAFRIFACGYCGHTQIFYVPTSRKFPLWDE
jgi:serine/threonine protein kinase